MAPRKPKRREPDELGLQFDITQEIEPELVDEQVRGSEPTLSQVDFEDITVALPPNPKPKS
jgi:hypothetical protein